MEEQEKPKLPKSVLNIPGTKADIQSGQLLISSGIPSLDELLGGGFPVGTVVFIEEDQYGSYSKIMLKYFLAEGIVSGHSTFIASQDTSTDNIIRELPAVSGSDPEPEQANAGDSGKMTIAFRYQNLPTTEKQKSLQIGHYYDLTKVMPCDVLNNADIFHWEKLNDNNNDPGTFSNSTYHHLLQSIKDKIKKGEFTITDKPVQRTVLRIGIHALGSPMWLSNNSTGFSIKQSRDLDMFVFCLRAIVRSAFAVAFITVPSHLLEKSSLERCIYSSDIVVRLQSFAGTELENNPILSDHHGYFQVIKLAAINSFVSKHPGSVEYTFKLKRKKFCIEKLHLPPAFGDEKEVPTMGCGSSGKHLLEF